MDYLKALHVISIVAWFAGLFYLPRLFVYHTGAKDPISDARFKVMEHKLYFYITTPAGLLTLFFGSCMLFSNHAFYATLTWMHVKLSLVFLLVLFHLYLGRCVYQFKSNKNTHSEKFYRCINEIPTLILIAVVFLSFVKP